MRRLSVLVSALAIALSTAGYAETANNTVEKPIVINNVTYKVIRTIDNNCLSIKVVDKDAKQVWASIPLGIQEWNFKLNNKVSSFEVTDLDGDKIPEIITACTIGDVQSAMYIFKYNTEKKTFNAVHFGYIGFKDLDRDFMVSDIPVINGENMVFENNSKIRCLGKIYTPNGPVQGYYHFELQNGKYMAGDPVPAQIDNPASPIKDIKTHDEHDSQPNNETPGSDNSEEANDDGGIG